MWDVLSMIVIKGMGGFVLGLFLSGAAEMT